MGFEKLIARYMELPTCSRCKFVMQVHRRGKSVHIDFRTERNDHLVGWTLFDPGAVGQPFKISNEPGMKGQKIRVGIKAKQPKGWLTVEGKVPPGLVGATRFLPGEFKIIDRGWYEQGVEKPYMFEYFLHGNKFTGRWIVRGLKMPRIDPKTKRPIKGKMEVAWLFWKPMDQLPYVFGKRAEQRDYIPPKDFIPIPRDWLEKEAEKSKELIGKWKKVWGKGELK